MRFMSAAANRIFDWLRPKRKTETIQKFRTVHPENPGITARINVDPVKFLIDTGPIRLRELANSDAQLSTKLKQNQTERQRIQMALAALGVEISS